MNYYVKRGDEQYGPYSLADLQRYLAQGSVLPTDLARSEALDEWSPVERVVGNIAVQQPPVNYGQAPSYGQTPAQAAAAWPSPPGLHWALLLLFGFITCGLFSWVWMFVQASFVNRLRPGCKAMLYYGLGVGGFVVGEILGLSGDEGITVLGGLIVIAGLVAVLVGHFNLKNALEEHYNQVEPMNLRLSGGMTFFFNTIYFQYHLCAIRERKQAGAQPLGGTIYTPSEREAMQNPPDHGNQPL
jgi:hypothetical protein